MSNKAITEIKSMKGRTRAAINRNLKSIEDLKEKKREVFRVIDKVRTDYKRWELAIIRIDQKGIR